MSRAASSANSLFGLTLLCVLLALPIGTTLAGWENGDWAEVFLSTNDLRDVQVTPDRAGGMLVAAIDTGPSYDRVLVSRIGHNGTELWGNNGIYLPIVVGTVGSTWPISLAAGAGGSAYVAFLEDRSTYHMLRLAYVQADGTHAWTVDVDNLPYLTPAMEFDVKITPSVPGSDVLMTWSKLLPDRSLYSARFSVSGTLMWHGPVLANWGLNTDWEICPDVQGGLLVAASRDDVVDEVRVQRLASTDGARMWGLDGSQIWTVLSRDLGIIYDGSGGAYISSSSVGIAFAQHVNSSGAKTWTSDVAVHDSQTQWWALPTYPSMCADDAGGFILVHGKEDLFAQRVNVNGDLLWGPTGVTVSNGTDEDHWAVIRRDGTGGAVIGYQNYWQIQGSTYCRQVYGARLDAFGTKIWDEYLWHCNFIWGPGGVPEIRDFPRDIRVVGDGSGGGIFAWTIHDEGSNDDEEVLAQGIAADGSMPTPRLTLLLPDAADSGDTGSYSIFGDYLDLTLGYELHREGGGISPFTLAPDQMLSPQLVEGSTTLTGLIDGEYHLIVDTAGTPEDTLSFALGIGDPPGCTADAPITESERSVDLAGSQRQSAFDGDGRLHLAWIEADGAHNTYSLLYARRNPDGGWEPPRPYFEGTWPLKHVTVAADVAGGAHLAMIREMSSTDHRIEYLRLDYGGDVVFTDEFANGTVNANPVMVILGEATPHIVFEKGSGPAELAHISHGGSSFSSATTVSAPGFPRSPDMTTVGETLTLTYVRNSFLPGIQQIDRQEYVPGSGWAAPQLLSFGLGMSSPSVAYDGAGRRLFAWIIDNEAVNGVPPLVHTVYEEAGVFGEVRARPGQSIHHAVSVASRGLGQFTMVTLESEGGPDMGVWLRDGDGRCFMPRLKINSHGDVAKPLLASDLGGGDSFAHWRDYAAGLQPVWGTACAQSGTGVGEHAPSLLARELRCIPNPFNPSTTFSFRLNEGGVVKLVVYDTRGRLVRTLLDLRLPAGAHAVVWNGQDDRDVRLGSGVYFARLTRPGGESSVTKVALTK
jgi:hypothetical protein